MAFGSLQCILRNEIVSQGLKYLIQNGLYRCDYHSVRLRRQGCVAERQGGVRDASRNSRDSSRALWIFGRGVAAAFGEVGGGDVELLGEASGEVLRVVETDLIGDF